MEESKRERICRTSDTSWGEIQVGEIEVKKASTMDWSAILGVNINLITVSASSWQSWRSRIFNLKRASMKLDKSPRSCSLTDVGRARTMDSTRVIIWWFEDFNKSVSMFYASTTSRSSTINTWAIRTSWNVFILSKIEDKRFDFCKRITLATIYSSLLVFIHVPHPSILVGSNLGTLLWYSILFGISLEGLHLQSFHVSHREVSVFFYHYRNKY